MMSRICCNLIDEAFVEVLIRVLEAVVAFDRHSVELP
jgi:hypothetical protein